MLDLKVVIVGAGVGGLSLAIALRDAGYAVEVYEQAPELTPTGGFGLCLWPNGAKAMNTLGLEREMGVIAPRLDTVRFLTKDGDLLSNIPMQPLVDATGQRPYPVTRSALQMTLLKRLGSGVVHLDAMCVGVKQDADGATASFADGRTATGDLVVGADGFRSAVRRTAVIDTVEEAGAGWRWEGLVRTPSPEHLSTFDFYVGDAKRAATLPVSDDQVYWFFDFPAPPDGDVEGCAPQLHHMYDDWCPAVTGLIDGLDIDRCLTGEYRYFEPIPTFVEGRVVLIGDAAHAMTPFLGQGAAQAAEDALVLSHFLQSTSHSVDDALERYDRERTGRTSRIVEGARDKAVEATGPDVDANERYYAALRGGGRDFVETVEHLTLDGPLR